MSQPYSADPVSPYQLRDYLRLLWTRKWSILFVVMAVTATTLWYTSQQDQAYTSNAEIVLEGYSLSTDPNPDPWWQGISVDAETTILASTQVTDRAARMLGLPKGSVAPPSITSEAESPVVALSYTAGRAHEAQRELSAIITAYTQLLRARALNELNDLREPVERSLAELDEDLSSLRAQLATERDETRRATLLSTFESLTSRRGVLQDKLESLVEPESISPVRVTQPASLPAAPSNPQPFRSVALGILAGLALGFAQALVRERLRDRPTTGGDFETIAGAPVLAALPPIKKRHRGKAPLVMLSAPDSAAAEVYRRLQSTLSVVSSRTPIKSLAITSALPGEGKTTVTANLAIALAQAGKKVILVEGDLRNPSLHSLLRLQKPQDGLWHVVNRGSPPDPYLFKTPVDNLMLLSGRPTDFLSNMGFSRTTASIPSDGMQLALEKLRELADYVLVDTPPVLHVADAVTIAALVDRVVLVADARRTTRDALAQARYQLTQVDSRVLCIVINNFRGGAPAYPTRYFDERLVKSDVVPLEIQAVRSDPHGASGS